MWLLLAVAILAYVISSRAAKRVFPYESLAVVATVAVVLVVLLQVGKLG